MSNFNRVYRAEPEDTQTIMHLLVNTAEWLLRKGFNQWTGLLRGEDSHNTPESINRGEVFLFEQEQQNVGMVILLEQPNQWDEELWGKCDDSSCIYVHRLTVDRKFSGRNLGKQMMQWVEAHSASEGVRAIRLDCLANNQVLNRFYGELGYELIGTGTNAYGEYSKYEKKV